MRLLLIAWPAIAIARLIRALPLWRCDDRPVPKAPAPRTPDMPPGFPARRAALRLLDAVLRRGQPLETALHGATQGLAPPDRALVHAIVAGVLRHMRDLDTLIDSATRQTLPDDAKARMVLRLALAQALVLATPDHAVIATALPLVDGGPRKLVHGVLGTLLRAGVALPDPPALPEAVEARWQEAWGDVMTAAAGRALASRPALDLSLRDPGETEAWTQRLGGVSLAPGHVRLPAETDVTALEGFAEGAFWVQDLAASLPARLLGAGEGRHVLDLCAAPGGKTMQLAAAGWRVTSLDQSARRLERLAETVARTGLETEVGLRRSHGMAARRIRRRHPARRAVQRDRHFPPPSRRAPSDRASPDRRDGRGPDRFARPRRRLAEAGGRLVYATCSLEPAEGEAQIDALLERRPDLSAADIDPAALPAGIAQSGKGRLRTLPGMLAAAGGLDGFFIALLERA